MLRILITAVSVALCAVMLALAAVQRRELVVLHEQQIQAQMTGAPVAVLSITSNEPTAAPSRQQSPSFELLRLRGEVGQLERRKRELTGTRVENEKLRVKLRTKGTNAPGGIVLPAGYLRKADAKYAGYNSPEDTVQTLLWAIQNRDVPGFLQGFDLEPAKSYEARMNTPSSADSFFKASVLPGIHILGKEDRTEVDGVVILMVQVVPGKEPERLRFKQVEAQWKLLEGF